MANEQKQGQGSGEMARAPQREGQLERMRGRRMWSPFEEMDRMFEALFPHGRMQRFRGFPEMAAAVETFPRVDVVDRDEDILLRAEVPGVEKKDLDISVTNDSVTIQGSTSFEEKEEKGNYYHCEISRGAFMRTITLPSDIDTDNTKASFKDGLLELTMPKVAKAKRRSISVQ